MAKAKQAKKLDRPFTMDRRSGKEQRGSADRRTSISTAQIEKRKSQRRTVTRRRQIDPTTCERDYTADEIEFMQAMDAYKRKSGRMFPTCSEVLEVIRSLGYEKTSKGTPSSDSEAVATHAPTLESAGVPTDDELADS